MAVERPMPYPGVPPKKGKDHGPSQAEIEAANAGQLVPKGAEKFLQRLARSWAFRLGLVAGASYGTYQVPAIQRAVDSVYHDTLQKLGLEVVVPTIFDNKLNKGAIGDNNIQLIPQDEAKKINIQPVGNDTSLTFPFPFQLPKGAQVTYERVLSEISIPQDARTEAAQKGIKDNMKFILPKDTLISAPVNSHVLSAVVTGQKTLENQNPSDWARLFYYDGIKDKTYVLWFFALDDASGHSTFNSLVPTQGNEPTAWRDTNWERLPKIQQGAPLLKTTKENQSVQLNIRAYKGKVVGPQAEIVDKTFFAVTPQFLTTATPEGQKLLVLAK